MNHRAGVVGLVAIVLLGCGRVRYDRGPAGTGASAGASDSETCTTTCDDGDPCTANDHCVAGVCSGEPRDCDDGLGCTLDRCVPGLGCQHETDRTLCDDGDPCTRDLCTAQGQCDNDALSGNVCGSLDCVAQSICDNGSCVSRSVDAAGVCYPTAIDFGDSIVGMTTERDLVLEAADGAFSVDSIESEHPDVSAHPPPLPRSVDQGRLLTVPLNWRPSAEGELNSRVQVQTDSVTWYVQVTGRALPQPDCDDDNPCTKDSFDTTSGKCTSESVPGAACDDGDPCTVADSCNATAQCLSGDLMECPMGQICKAGECKPRLCLDAANLAPACASVAAPLGEGCLCELVYDAAPAQVQTRIAEILDRPGYNQTMIVSSLFAQLLIEGWDLRFPHPQLDSAAAVNQALSRWDLNSPFQVAGVSNQPGQISETSDVLTLLTRYEELEAQPNLAALTQNLIDAGFSATLPEYRTLGFATQTERLIRRILATSAAQLPALVVDLKASLASRETGLNDIVRIAFNQPKP